MELLYLWVEEYSNIRKEGFQFSQNFSVQYNQETNYINIKKKVTPLFKFSERVDNITTIIGKNGTGKTSILDVLGIKRDDRNNLTHTQSAQYFIIYYAEEDNFIIEGSGTSLIKNCISDFPKGTNIYEFVKETYSIIVSQEKDRLIYKGFLQSGHSDYDYIDGIKYFNFRHVFTGEPYKSLLSMKIENEYTYHFNRVNLSRKNTGSSAVYKMIIDLNKNKEKDANNTKFLKSGHKVTLKIQNSLFHNYDLDLPLKKGFKERSFTGRKQSPPIEDFKNDFINRLLYEYCYSFSSHLLTTPETENEKDTILKIIASNKLNKKNYIDYYLNIIKELFNLMKQHDEHSIDPDYLIGILGDYIKDLGQFDVEWFYKETIEIPVENEVFPSVEKLLLRNDDLKFNEEEASSFFNMFSIEFYPLSSGEEALLSLFSALHYGLTIEYNKPKSKAIILLDEPDNFLHPEWCRILIHELIHFLDRLENGYESYQLIISTHSPFIISDLPKDHVIALTKDRVTSYCKQVPLKEDDQTFASNIHSLFAKDFFMESTIGEFAKQKINNVIKSLGNPKQLSPEEIDELYFIIDCIGEPLLKGKLKMMADKAFDKKMLIKKLKAQLMELEKDDTN